MPLCDRRVLDLSWLRRASVHLLAVLAMSLLTGTSARAAAVTFAPPVSYTVPGGGGITPVDLDGDGKLDMVVTGAQGMFFFYGKGDGTFEPAVVVPILTGWTIAADVNGDSLPDLIAVRGDDSAIVIMNQGQRHFAAPVAYPVGHGPAGVAAGDFNGDGLPDMAVANIGADSMAVLLNKGDGTFGPAVFYPSGSGARVILTADLNGDGNLDLVMGQDSSYIVYRGDGKGGFAASGNYPTGGGYPGMTLLDDFNGDGIPDVATANTFSNNVSVFLGDGLGSFLPPTFYGTIQYPHVFASADLDEDGAPDIAVPHNGTSAFSVLQNQGNGLFLPAVTFDAGGSNTRMLGIGDFNGDGLPDVVTDNESSNTVSVLINTTPRSSPALRSLALAPTLALGGSQTIQGFIALTAPAPTGGAVVTLATNNPAVSVPPTVTIPEGQTTASLVLGTTPVATARRGNVTASCNSTVKRIAVTVRPPAVRFVLVSPSPFVGGQPATGKVIDEVPAGPNGLTVTLSSSNPAVVQVPATVTIPAGQNSVSFPFTSLPVSVPTTVVVSSTAGGVATGAVLTVLDLGVPLPAVNGTAAPPVYNPANGHWYQEVQGPGLTWAQARDAAAALSYAGLPGHLVTLSSANENQFIANNVPNAQAGSTHWIGGYQDHLAPDYSEPTGGWRWVTGEPWSFTCWNGGEPNNAGGEDFLQWFASGIWNDLPGRATITGYLVEYEPFIPPLLSITFSPVSPPSGPTAGGQRVSGMVTLAQPAGPNPVTIYLASDHPAAITVPATLTVPAGQNSATFTATVYPVAADTNVVLTADGRTANATVTVPLAGLGLVLPPVSGTAAPPVYNPANGHWYQEIQGPPLTWAQARDAAAALSYAGLPGHLATLNSFNENQFIANNVPDAQSGTTHWIGGFQDRFAPDYSEPTGGWRWVTGELWSFTSWNSGEPNNAGGEDFLQWFSAGIWNDLPGGATIAGYLVEYEPSIQRIAPSQVTLTPNPVTGGESTTGTVTLSQPAGPNGLTVYLNSDHPTMAVLPSSVQVPAGQTTVDFGVTTNPVSAPTVVQITADAPMGSAAAPLTVNDTGVPLPLVDGNTGPPVYNSANGHWYQEVQGPALTWAQARDAAAALSYDGLPGHLTTVTSSDEVRFIVNNVPNAQSGTTHWIGAYQDHLAPDYREPTGGWRWVTGEKWDYTNWNGGEPNNAGGEDFLQWLPSGIWNDLPGGAAITAYLVEYEPPIAQFAVSQVTITPNPVTGGQTATGTVTLAQAAGAGGVSVALGSNQPQVAAVPSATTVPAGQTTASFPVTTNPVPEPTPVLISASGPTGSASTTLQVTEPGTRALSLSVSGPLNFGTQAVGTPSAAQTVSIANRGSAPLTLASLTLGGSNASEFALVAPLSTPNTLAPGESRAMSLVFTPAGIGLCAATLTFASDATSGPTTLALTGTGAGPMVRLSPTALAFGPEPVGLNGTLALLIQNNGNAPLHVGGITFEGANASDFSLATDGLTGHTLQPGEISLLNVRFAPSQTGDRAATLVMSDDAADSPHSIALTGFGTAPLLRLSTDSLVFGLQASSAQLLKITNGGDAPLTIEQLLLSGPDAGSFQIVSDTGEKTVPVGGSRNVLIAFQSATIASRQVSGTARIAAASRYNATLEIKDNDPHATTRHTVALLATGSGTAPTGDSRPPGAPTRLAAQVVSCTEIDLTWADNSSNEQAFAVWRKDGSGDWRRIAVIPPNGTRFADRGLPPGTSHNYRVRATAGSLASLWSNEAPASTPPLRPAAPGNLTATVVSPREAGLTWSRGIGDETGVAIFRQSGSGAWQRLAELLPSVTHFTDRSVQPGGSYRYRVRTHDGTQVSVWSNEAPATTPPLIPTAPSGLIVTVVSGAELDLAWKSGGGDEVGVSLFRRTGQSDWQRIAVLSPSITRYQDRSVTAGMSYTYRLRTHTDTRVSAWSNEATATAHDLPPATPTHLTAVVVSPGEIDLAWECGRGGETGVALFRRTGTGDWQRMAVLPAGTTRCQDRSVTAGASYTYRLRTHNDHDASAWTNEATGATPVGR
jgi:VCBS repeat protein/HYDIN/CFA65/VesB family protein/lectin-like protein